MGTLQDKIDAVKNRVIKVKESVASKAHAVYENLIDTIKNFPERLRSAVNAIGRWLKNGFEFGKEAVIALGKLLKYVVTHIPSILKYIGEAISGIAKFIGKAAYNIIKGIPGAIKDFVQAIPDILKGIVNSFVDMCKFIGRGFKFLGKAIKFCAKVIWKLIKAIPDIIKELPEIAKFVWEISKFLGSWLLKSLKSLGSFVGEKLLQLLTNIVGGIVGSLYALVEIIRQLFSRGSSAKDVAEEAYIEPLMQEADVAAAALESNPGFTPAYEATMDKAADILNDAAPEARPEIRMAPR